VALIPYIKYDEKKIHYQIQKNEKDKAIIFIHGSGESSNIWKNQLKLNINYSLIAIDLPSHNKSESFSKLSLDLYVDVIKELVHSLKINEIILCGHSLGGAVIQSFYFKYPENVKALILCATGAKLRVTPIILNSLKNNYQEYLNSIPIGAFYRKTPKQIINEFLEEASKINPEIAYADYSICDNFNVMNKINLIDIPCLIIVGKADKLTPLKYSLYFRENIANSELVVIEKAGHMVIIEKPNEVNKAIKEFIKDFL